jgi:hypothetical protein
MSARERGPYASVAPVVATQEITLRQQDSRANLFAFGVWA